MAENRLDNTKLEAAIEEFVKDRQKDKYANIMELLEKDAERIKPDVFADQKIAMESVEADRPYADRIKKEINEKFMLLYSWSKLAILLGINILFLLFYN